MEIGILAGIIKNFSLFLGSAVAVALAAVRQSSLGKSTVGAVLLAGMLGMNSLKAGEPGGSWEYPGGLTPPPPTVTAYIHVFGNSWDDFNLWFEVLPVYTVTGGIEVVGDTVLNVYPYQHLYAYETLWLYSVVDESHFASDHFDKETENDNQTKIEFSWNWTGAFARVTEYVRNPDSTNRRDRWFRRSYEVPIYFSKPDNGQAFEDWLE